MNERTALLYSTDKATCGRAALAIQGWSVNSELGTLPKLVIFGLTAKLRACGSMTNLVQLNISRDCVTYGNDSDSNGQGRDGVLQIAVVLNNRVNARL
jgi:hypothetical protein